MRKKWQYKPRFFHLLVLLWVLISITACSSVDKRDESSPEKAATAQAELGLAYLQQSNLERAQDKLERALQLDPDSVAAHHYMAELLRRRGMMEEAKMHYKKALRIDPSNLALHNNFGAFLCSQGEYRDAEKQFLHVINSRNYEALDEVYENAGLCELQSRDKDKAEKYFRKALELNPVLPKTLYQMSLLSFDQRQYLRARAFLQRHLAVASPSAGSLWLGIRIERELGDNDTAAEMVRTLERDFPGSDEAQKLMR